MEVNIKQAARRPVASGYGFKWVSCRIRASFMPEGFDGVAQIPVCTDLVKFERAFPTLIGKCLDGTSLRMFAQSVCRTIIANRPTFGAYELRQCVVTSMLARAKKLTQFS